jgi:hypothetical protein
MSSQFNVYDFWFTELLIFTSCYTAAVAYHHSLRNEISCEEQRDMLWADEEYQWHLTVLDFQYEI